MSAIIGIRCDECGRMTVSEPGLLDRGFCIDQSRETGWSLGEDGDFCPFCVARRKAKEQAEAIAK